MCKNIIRILIVPFVLVFPARLMAQQFLWDVDLKVGFDNREYAEVNTVIPSGTTFGAHLIPKVGLGFSDGHAICAGANFGRYFGKTSPQYDIEALLYYQYDGPHLFVNVGAFPGKNRTGHYPYAFQDEDRFFNNIYEGAVLRYTRRDWMFEAACDWFGCYEKHNRERFGIFSFARYQNKKFPYVYAASSFMMHHYAGSGTVRGVVDNIWLYPYIGVDMASLTPLKKLGARAGWLQTFQNDRINNTGYLLPGGLQLELEIEYWGFGILDNLYLGKNLQPFYNSMDAAGKIYGDNLYLGQRFYSTNSGLYNRLEIYWNYYLNDMLSVQISSVHHCDGHHWGWQQWVKLTANLNNFQFPNHKERKMKVPVEDSVSVRHDG